ncbi:hypothetical protein ACSTJG_24640, partial [Vibrio parahaemolyticus]
TRGAAVRHGSGWRALALACAGMAAAVAGPAQAGDDQAVPFWASLGKDQANMRVGPGRDYRINWIYVRKGVP